MCWCGDYFTDKFGYQHWIQVHDTCNAINTDAACNANCWQNGDGFPYFALLNNCDPNADPFTNGFRGRHQMRHKMPRNFSPAHP
jgi:hypothetical protein